MGCLWLLTWSPADHRKASLDIEGTKDMSICSLDRGEMMTKMIVVLWRYPSHIPFMTIFVLRNFFDVWYTICTTHGAPRGQTSHLSGGWRHGAHQQEREFEQIKCGSGLNYLSQAINKTELHWSPLWLGDFYKWQYASRMCSDSMNQLVHSCEKEYFNNRWCRNHAWTS